MWGFGIGQDERARPALIERSKCWGPKRRAWHVRPSRWLIPLLAVFLVGIAGSAAARARSVPPAANSQQTSWARYETDVNPGSRLIVAAPGEGFALSHEPTNGFDESLATPAGMTLAWPSPALTVSRDGGRSWSTALRAPGGFWGVTSLGAKLVWAVGVTSLYRSDDGGGRWQRDGEPSRPLVRVAFSTPDLGFGLTSAGQLMTSNDAGRSWRSSSLRKQGQALCVTSAGTVLVADASGAIWRSAAVDQRWTRAAAPLPRLYGFSHWWPDLSCHGSRALETTQAFCFALLDICGSNVVTRVRESRFAGRRWTQVFAQQARPSAAGGVVSQPEASLTIPFSHALIGGRGLCLLGFLWVQPDTVQVVCGGGADAYQAGRTPPLPLPAKQSTVLLPGADFVNQGVGWLELDEYTAAATPRQSAAVTEVWTTANGGLTWTEKYRSHRYHPG
jgi:hypothetical protein